MNSFEVLYAVVSYSETQVINLVQAVPLALFICKHLFPLVYLCNRTYNNGNFF
jgi:hypothetical protein